MGLWSNYKSAMTQYAKFSGRATRSEFWLGYIMIMIIIFLMSIVMAVISIIIMSIMTAYNVEKSTTIYITGFIENIPLIIHILPILALSSRRLHDRGHSFIWWGLVPGIALSAIIIGWAKFFIPSNNLQTIMHSSSFLSMEGICGIIGFWFAIQVFLGSKEDNKYGKRKIK